MHANLMSSIKKAAHDTLPKRKRPSPGWFKSNEEKLQLLISERNKALSAKIRRPTRRSIKRLREARRSLKIEISRSKNCWISDVCSDINESTASKRGTKSSWDKLKLLQKGLQKPKPTCERMMCKEDGSKYITSKENADVFKRHFEKLYRREPSYDRTVLDLLDQLPLQQEYDSPPTDDDIKKAVLGLRNKAPGDSGITPRMLKSILKDEQLYIIFKHIIIDFWENELPPELWEIGLLKILPKKGDLSKPGNYRGIMLLEVVYKVVAKIIHSRLQPIVESLDHEAQCGFRPGRGCADAVFSVKLAMKKRREHGLQTWILFLDLVKAFDRVPRQLLWDILYRFGVPPKLVSIIKSLHKNMDVKFTVDEVAHTIKSGIGVKQGDILGPVLFTIFIAAILISWSCLLYTSDAADE